MDIRTVLETDLNKINTIRSECNEKPIGSFDIQCHQGFITFLGEKSGEVIGYISLSPETENEKITDKPALALYIRPVFQKMKFGTTLLNHAIEYAKKSEYIKGVKLAVSPENKSAIKIYKKIGFNGNIEKGKVLCRMYIDCTLQV
jgi:ribosomal protein S18 acetylase RimI-like enzyme